MKQTLKTVLGAGLGILLVGCGSPSFLAPNSTISNSEAHLYWILIYLSIAVFLLVEIWLAINIIRWRRRPGDDTPPEQIHGNNRLEIIWTVLPILLVTVIFILTVRTVQAVAPPSPQASDLNVHVIGHRWWWEFDYPDQGVITANELHIPVGTTVQLTLDSADVIHSFWVPQLSGKTDVIPGQTNHMWMKADTIGEFHGQCAEFCGQNHANMRIKVVVQSQADFDAWLQNQEQDPPQPQTADQQAGYKLITTGICSNCHALGTVSGPDNPVGPNLNHLFSRSVFAGATYDLTEDNIRRWLTQNQQMKPGNDMNVTLTSDQVNQLMAYLTTLK